ncbi:MFS transporter [Candidatus Viridilinea mediisalina]|uniref:MFS transporter n=1 Tax=Candidatus Viridilinea mediisalina TaxID=2024553 RepID=A0A2A6RJ02_9CHLR|nr:MFS transporter [Candidatus Viridilinea mediisalina]PDW02830.1 MFS transporter [Candidatus Viridilinea mediisalina]
MNLLSLQIYLRRISPPVWRIFIHSILFGLAISIADLLFNFYLISLGYGADTVGLLSTVSRLAGVFFGVPMGMLIDRFDARRATLWALVVYCLGWGFMLLSHSLWALILAQSIIGAAFLTATMALVPLLASVTNDDERADVFGLNASATLMIGLVGSSVGGMLPLLVAGLLGSDPQATVAYRFALLSVIGLSLLAMLPLRGRFPVVPEQALAATVPAESQALPLRSILRLVSSGLLLGIGGGAIIPFQNLFFRDVFGLPDAAVGIVFALGCLGMGLGALLGPFVCKALGLQRGAALLRFAAIIGLLFMLAPMLSLAIAGVFLRGLLLAASFPMNDALIMQHTPFLQRGLAMSMLSVLWAAGWALSALICGMLQVHWGFTPLIIIAAVAFSLSAWLILSLRLVRSKALG